MTVRTAFVFAGGGSLGASQVGMLKPLAEAGVRPDLLVGSSVGAINAAYFAADPTLHGANGLDGIWRDLRRREVFRLSLAGGLLGLLGRRSHFFNAELFGRFLARHLPYRLIEESAIPCHIVASDLVSGDEIVLSRGSLLDALQASAAIPGVFPPVKIAGRFLIDGGIANHTPVSTAVSLGATRLVVLPTGFTCSPEKSPAGALDMALHALNLIIARQLVQDLESYKDRAQLTVIPPLCPQKTHPLDFRRSGELIDQGRETTRAWLAAGGLEKDRGYQFLLPHRH